MPRTRSPRRRTSRHFWTLTVSVRVHGVSVYLGKFRKDTGQIVAMYSLSDDRLSWLCFHNSGVGFVDVPESETEEVDRIFFRVVWYLFENNSQWMEGTRV